MSLFKRKVSEEVVANNIVEIKDAVLKSHSVRPLYTLKDNQTGQFDIRLFTAPVDEHAFRFLVSACSDSKTELATYPDSYSLYHVGYFILETGKIITLDSPRLVSQVADAAKIAKARLEVKK